MSSHRQQYVRRALLQRRLQPGSDDDDDGGRESRTREQRQRRIQDQERHRLRLQGHQSQQSPPSFHHQQQQQFYRRAQPPPSPSPPSPPQTSSECSVSRPRIVELPDGALFAALIDDGYRLGSTVGHGSYSKVRVALCSRPGAATVKLACKVIDKKRGAGRSASYQCKFLPRELDLLRRVRHPNLIRTHRIYVTPSAVHVFMEYCELGDLLNHLQRSRGGMPYWQTRTFFRQICDAVDYLHRNDISHRDIKCENLLLESMEVVKLTDFGFARMCSDEWGQRLMSQTFCGSSAYAAPEVLKGIPYDPKAYDVWAVGVVLYVMLADCMPYPQTDHKQIITNQMARKLTKPKKPVNQEALEFVSIILEPDVMKRLTIGQIKNHSWFGERN